MMVQHQVATVPVCRTKDACDADVWQDEHCKGTSTLRLWDNTKQQSSRQSRETEEVLQRLKFDRVAESAVSQQRRISVCSTRTPWGATSHRWRNLSIAQKYPYEVIQKKRCISTGLETKSDRQSNSHAGVQDILSTKLREENQQLRMNHDSKHQWDWHWSQGRRTTKTGDGTGAGARRGKRNHSMEVATVWRSTRRIWTNTGTTSPLGVNSEQEEDSGQTTNEIGVQTLVLTLVSRTPTVQQPESRKSSRWRKHWRSSNPEWRCAVPKVRLRHVKVQQAESEVLINRNSCSIHSRRSIVSASEMSHEWREVSLKIDRATAVTMSRRGARGHITKRKDETFHTTTLTTHHQTPQRSTTQHSTSWRSATDAILLGHREHTGGSRSGHPRYTRADYDQEAVGGSTSRARAHDTSHRHKLWTRVATKQPGSGVRVQSTRSMLAEQGCRAPKHPYMEAHPQHHLCFILFCKIIFHFFDVFIFLKNLFVSIIIIF